MAGKSCGRRREGRTESRPPDEHFCSEWFWHVAAAAIYICTTLAVSWHGTNLGEQLLGGGTDPFIYTWFLAWWPYAFQHHLAPFFTHLVWQPDGLNLGWTTSIPTLSLLASPLTAAIGPVLTYDMLMLLAPVFAAMGAYALCLYLCRSPSASLVGGWLFGFSSFATAHINQQLNLEWTVLVPLLVLVGLKRLDGHIGRFTTVLAIGLMLAAQAGISLEIFATMIVMSVFAWSLAWLTLAQLRARLLTFAVDVLVAAPVTFLFLSPMLLAMFGKPHDMSLPKMWPEFFSTDPVNFFLPTEATWLGGKFFLPVSSHFSGLLCEQGAYLGFPLFFILWRYLRRSGWFLALLLVGILLASCGPQLVVGSRETGIPLPWLVMLKLPLIGNALPSRLMVYASLLAAVIASLWLADALVAWRWSVAFLAILFLWPAAGPVEQIPSQPFFVHGEVEKAIGDNKRLLILPFGIFSPSMYWQMTSHFAFSQAGGYLVFPPARLQNNAPMMKLFFGSIGPDTLKALEAYCYATHVDALVVAPGADPALVSGVRAFHWASSDVKGVTIYSVPQISAH